MDSKEKVVVIGGGFAGINLVKRLDRKRYDVTLVDRNNFHSFPPLFYQVAASGLEPASISFPFRREMRKMDNAATYHMGDVKSIDVAGKKVVTRYETIPYDKLVIATGTTNNFFNMHDLYKRVFTIKSTGEAIRCRNEILDRLERASICRDDDERKKLLSFTVIGGGPTGVEVAGALGEMKRYILRREYKSIPPEQLVITLVEGSDRLLHTMSETASRFALKYLKELSVNVVLKQSMKSYDDNVLTFADGLSQYSGMVIWTAGVTGDSPVIENGELPRGAGNRILVDAYNRVEGHDDIFALGDIALHCDEMYPRGCPQLAQVAIQQARNLAKNLNRGMMENEFSYKDKGSMATIGRNRAVADLKHFQLTGVVAWFVWMFIHLISLLGMRNKLVVLTNWVWAYFSYPTSLRLLFRPSRYPLRSHQ